MPKQNTAPSDFPQAVLQQIEQLGQYIAIARKRRGESQAQWAKRLGVSQPTMARIERGDPAVSMAFYVMAMWLINQAEGLADLIAPQHDLAALDKEIRKMHGTVRATKKQATAAAVHTVSEPVVTAAFAPQRTAQMAQASHAQRTPSQPAQPLTAASKTTSLLARAAALAATQHGAEDNKQ